MITLSSIQKTCPYSTQHDGFNYVYVISIDKNCKTLSHFPTNQPYLTFMWLTVNLTEVNMTWIQSKWECILLDQYTLVCKTSAKKDFDIMLCINTQVLAILFTLKFLQKRGYALYAFWAEMRVNKILLEFIWFRSHDLSLLLVRALTACCWHELLHMWTCSAKTESFPILTDRHLILKERLCHLFASWYNVCGTF